MQEHQPVKIANAFEQLSSKEIENEGSNVRKKATQEPIPMGDGLSLMLECERPKWPK